MWTEFLAAFNFFIFGTLPPTGSTGLQCVPNKLFIYDHNICYCDDKGQEITCKRKMYSTVYPELRAYQLQNLTLAECEKENPGEKVIDYGCYKCICRDDKYASCIPSKCNDKSVSNTKEKCIPGSIFADKCNGCVCGPDGTAACTKLDCYTIHGLKKPDDVVCVPNDNLIVGCNQCSCSTTGMEISCEKVGCDFPNFVHRHLINVTTFCIPNNPFNYGPCHKCICSHTGTFGMCTGVPCQDQYNVEEEEDNAVTNTVDNCNPGIIFENNCNVCVCNESGKGVCSTLNCDLDYSFKYVKQLSYAIPGV